MAERERIRRVFLRLAEAQNHRCCYCFVVFDYTQSHGWTSPTREHVISRASGGGNTQDNLVIACRQCNELRAQLQITAEEFFDFVQKNGNTISKDWPPPATRTFYDARWRALAPVLGDLWPKQQHADVPDNNS